jgi:hypothetical protein
MGVVVAIIGLLVGGSAVAVTVKIVTSPPKPSTTGTAPIPDRTSTPASSPPAARQGAKVTSWTTNIVNGSSLSYQTGASNEVIFNYYASSGYLDAGQDVNLALLSAPAPTFDSAYQACENLSANGYTQQIPIDAIAPGDTLCAFMPNTQVAWVQFLGTQNDQNAFTETLRVSVTIWQGL